MSEINVTPLVDVMLVLLVIFMVTAPLLTTGIPLDLPKTAGGDNIEDSDSALNVSVDQEGLIYLGEEAVEIDELISRLASMLRSNVDLRVVISGDKNAAYGRIIEVMGELKRAGFSKVGLKTEPVHIKKKR
jgi:biopolymer transport protein TolR